MSSAYAQNYSIVFSAVVSLLGGTVPQGYAVTKSSDGTSYVIASTANLATSASGTIDGVALETGAGGSTIHIQRDAKVPASAVGFTGTGIIENAVVDSNGLVRRASAASGTLLGIVDKEGAVQINLAGAVSTVSYTLTGDVIGPSGSNTAVKIQNRAVASTAPTDGQALIWSNAGSTWQPGTVAITYGGDLDPASVSGNQGVLKIHGASVPAAGGLTTGNVLQVSGVSTLTYAPVNLAGGANYVTGTLPFGNGGTGLSALGSGLQYLRTNAGVTAMEWATLTPTVPGGSTTWMQYNNAGAFGGTAEFTYASSKLNVSSSGAITLGTNGGSVASGYIRAPGAATSIIVSRNNANSADFVVLSTDTTNRVLVGSGTNQADTWITGVGHVSLIVGATTALDTTGSACTINGSVSTTTYLFASQTNQVNAGTGAPASTPANGSLYIRNDPADANTFLYGRIGGAWVAMLGATTAVTWANDLAGSTNTSQVVVALTGSGGVVTVRSTAVLSFNGATSVSTAGWLRFPTPTTNQILVGARNHAGTANLACLYTDSTDTVYVGDANVNSGSNGFLIAGNQVGFQIGGTQTVVCSSTQFIAFSVLTVQSSLISLTATNVSIGTLSPAFNSATNTVYVTDGTAPTADPAAGMYLSCCADKSGVTGGSGYPLIWGTGSGGSNKTGLQFINVTSSTTTKTKNAMLLVTVNIAGTWSQRLIDLIPT